MKTFLQAAAASSPRRIAGAAAAFSLLVLLGGCGSNSSGTAPPPPPPGSGVTFGGKAMAGTQPISGATVQLYAAGTTGNGSAATALLTSAVTTDATGAFTVPAGYQCPSGSSQLLLKISGGKVGTAAENSAIVLATALGACNQLTASTQFAVNEVTTAATAWGLSQFLSTGGDLGASSTNAQGLANAVANVANLVNLTTGASPGAGFPATASSPAAKLNSLANLLNACTAAATTAPCSQLFASATPTGGTAPTNTFIAALDMARNPGSNVAALYTQSTTSTAFSPALTVAPADWTLFINYKGGGMNSPGALGVDAKGNVWVASYFAVASEFSPTGSPVFANGITGGGLCNSYGLAIDPGNNVWITNEASSSPPCSDSVVELSPSGQFMSGAKGYSAGGLNYPIAIAIDANSTAWVVDYGNSHLTQYNSSGQPLSGATGYSSTNLVFPVAIAIDGNHNAWVANQGDTTVTKVSPDGKQFTNISCCDGASGLAFDPSGNLWVANYFGDSVSEISSSGSAVPNPYTGGGLNHPQGIAVDGAGNVWVANYRGPSITELAGTASSTPGKVLSPPAGFAPDAALLQAFAIAIDASGNIWVTNFGSNTLIEFVGLATPVKTPLLGLPQAP
ncbi:NHL repeat-containing protein [Edaphobacter sp.]|uniref:NHL repeat-containing protein n=1 Tax=Edaphobacter sp. TaxID=1934404 RepID=UPI002DBC4591|nr:NHL repeat-containing protein [Edaphobacter sp.]HEU5342686.1 NHL repeat-containing protein [Edaphobacter sp.]